jgi:hypothetical protein
VKFFFFKKKVEIEVLKKYLTLFIYSYFNVFISICIQFINIQNEIMVIPLFSFRQHQEELQ